MVAGQLPEQVRSIVLARRQRRTRAWLVVSAALHLLMLALTVGLLPLARLESVGSLLIVLGFAIMPLVWLWWLERRRPSARNPYEWPLRSLLVAVPQAMALMSPVFLVLRMDESDAFQGWQPLLFIFVVSCLPSGAAALARRSLLHPLVPELGEGDFEVVVEPRTSRRPWYYSDEVMLNDRVLVITVRSGSGRATWSPKVERIALADVTAVGVRPAWPSDSPWITLSDGRGLSVVPGDVMVVQYPGARRVLPVANAAVFAEIVRVRASKVRGAAVATLAGDELGGGELGAGELGAGEPDGGVGDAALPTWHLPEVLPAPEPTGPVAQPIAGPVAPPRSGPGMAIRWALGYPLALLGIVGMPVGLLLLGGLLPAAEPGLERHRLGLCALWILVATVLWLWSRQQPRYWPAWALTSSLATAIIVAFEDLGFPALLGPIVAVLLTWAGRRILLQPIGTDLAASQLELPVQVHGGLTLLVQRDRIVFKVYGGGGGAVPQALPLADVVVVQPGELAGNEVRWWPLPGAQVRLWCRGMLRLVSGRQQWLLPVDAPRELAAIIRARAATARRYEPRPLTREQWYDLHFWAARQLTTKGHNLKQRTVAWRLALALPVAFFCSVVLNDAFARNDLHPNAFIFSGITLAIAVPLIADWIRVRRRLRVAEDNALPPGSPDWGELRPGHAPMPGWQPWWDAPHRL